MSLNWYLSDVFPIISWGQEFRGARPQRWSTIFIILHQKHILSVFVPGDTDLDHLATVEFVRFLHCKVILLSPFIPFFYVIVAFALFDFSFYFSVFWVLFYIHCDTHLVHFLLSNFVHSICPTFFSPHLFLTIFWIAVFSLWYCIFLCASF